MYLCTEYLLPLLQITPSMLTFYPLLFVLMLVLSLGSMEILARLPFHELLIGKVERRLLLRRKSAELIAYKFVFSDYDVRITIISVWNCQAVSRIL